MVQKRRNLDLSSKRSYKYKKSLTSTKYASPNILRGNAEHQGEKYTANNEIIRDDIRVHQGKKNSIIN